MFLSTTSWDVVAWGALVPEKINLSSMHRINTYPLIHGSALHFLLNVPLAVLLLERFEAGNGTLVTAAMLAGPFSTLPAALYLLFEKVIWRGNAAIMGLSTWVSVLIAVETAKTYKSNPHFNVGVYKIPTWSIPFVVTVLLSFLIPDTSLLANLCAVTVGTLFGLGPLKLLVPPERPLRWIEGKLNLLARVPHYVSVDQKTYGRYGVLPTSSSSASAAEAGIPMSYRGPSQRLGT